MNIWELCEGHKHIQNIAIEAWRVVEAQHILSTRDLVNTPEEHDILEGLLEASKPPIHKEKNYLIFTPFRYPPLQYGSRFGATVEPSLWYGSLTLETAFAEVAYYRLRFFKDTSAELGFVELSMTAFSTSMKGSKAVDLTCPPFNQYASEISHKTDYTYSQALGSAMRMHQIELFLYYSARTHTAQKNVAAYSPDVFHSKKGQYIHNQQTWTCFSHKNTVEFTRMDFLEKKSFCYSSSHFSLIRSP